MPEILRAIQVSRPQRLLFSAHGNECASIIESIDWSKTYLGQPDEWSPAFHVTLSIVMNAKVPMFLFWGADRLCFYNDTTKSLSPGLKHPFSIGKKAEIVFAEKWHILKPRLDRVIYYGESLSDDGLVLVYNPSQKISSSFCYSPVYAETGRREGVLVTGLDFARMQ